MGKKSKPFIDKDKGQKFHLLHRSYNDAAYANEETPSEFVLVPAEPVIRKAIYLFYIYQLI